MRELMDDGGSGDAQVDEAVRTLESLEGLPVHEHAPMVERVHQVLLDRLAGEPDALPEDDSDALSAAEHDAAAGDDHGESASPGRPTPYGGTAGDGAGSGSGGAAGYAGPGDGEG
ncbi:hypothetical protein [Jiangella endophytica]|uniref:hypothetical protein n=1 Tax=Jiangella endophytica TaxID=1623398 RepID=UPI000E347243|nr:hypothetical protein [Jiangella endophytica]